MGVLLEMSSNSTPCWYCGNWIHFDESVRYPNGKCVPLLDNGQKHDFRDCPKSSYNLRKESKIRARAAKKSAIKKISEYQRVEEAKEYIRNVNARLHNYELVLSAKQLQPVFGEGA
jgi:hypothetical protein